MNNYNSNEPGESPRLQARYRVAGEQDSLAAINGRSHNDGTIATLIVPAATTLHKPHWTKTSLPIIILSATQFVAILDGMLVNVALPSIESGLQIAQQDLQWVVNAYLLVFGSFLMAGGRFSDVFGSRRLFLGGMTL